MVFPLPSKSTSVNKTFSPKHTPPPETFPTAKFPISWSAINQGRFSQTNFPKCLRRNESFSAGSHNFLPLSLSLVVSRPKQAASCFPWLPVAPHLPPPNLPPNSCQKFQSPRGYLISLHLVSLASHHVSSDGVSRGSVRIFIFMLFFIEARHTDAVFFLPEVRFQFVVWNWILPLIYHPPPAGIELSCG